MATEQRRTAVFSAIMGALLSLVLGVGGWAIAINARVSAVESQVSQLREQVSEIKKENSGIRDYLSDMVQRLARIEGKIDRQ